MDIQNVAMAGDEAEETVTPEEEGAEKALPDEEGVEDVEQGDLSGTEA